MSYSHNKSITSVSFIVQQVLRLFGLVLLIHTDRSGLRGTFCFFVHDLGVEVARGDLDAVAAQDSLVVYH